MCMSMHYTLSLLLQECSLINKVSVVYNCVVQDKLEQQHRTVSELETKSAVSHSSVCACGIRNEAESSK